MVVGGGKGCHLRVAGVTRWFSSGNRLSFSDHHLYNMLARNLIEIQQLNALASRDIKQIGKNCAFRKSSSLIIYLPLLNLFALISSCMRSPRYLTLYT